MNRREGRRRNLHGQRKPFRPDELPPKDVSHLLTRHEHGSARQGPCTGVSATASARSRMFQKTLACIRSPSPANESTPPEDRAQGRATDQVFSRCGKSCYFLTGRRPSHPRKNSESLNHWRVPVRAFSD